jgi:putative endonuclease
MRDADRIIAVYIMASARNGTIYIGVTADLMSRVQQHQAARGGGFTSRYSCKTLVWYEQHGSIIEAIIREKTLKKWRRRWKTDLIEARNPQWLDLAEGW